MGSRAAIVFRTSTREDFSPLVYLHYYGAPEYVYAYLDELARRGAGNNEAGGYAARFMAVVQDHFNYPAVTPYSVYAESPPTGDSAEAMRAWGEGCDNGSYLVEIARSRLPGESTPSWVVRRFGGHGDTFKEVSPRAARSEERAARKMTSHVELAATLRRLRPFVERYGPESPYVPVADGLATVGRELGDNVWRVGDDLYQGVTDTDGTVRPKWLCRLFPSGGDGGGLPAAVTKTSRRRLAASA